MIMLTLLCGGVVSERALWRLLSDIVKRTSFAVVKVERYHSSQKLITVRVLFVGQRRLGMAKVRTNLRTNLSSNFECTTHENEGFSRQSGPESSLKLWHKHCHGTSLPYVLLPCTIRGTEFLILSPLLLPFFGSGIYIVRTTVFKQFQELNM